MHFSFLPAKINPSKIYNRFEFHRCIFPSFRSIRAFEEIKLLFTYSGVKDSRNILHRIKSNFILYRFEYKFSDNSPFQKHFFAANSDASFALKISRLTYSVEERPLAHTSFFTSIIETSSLRAHRVQK